MSSPTPQTNGDDDSVPGDGTPSCPNQYPVKATDRSNLYFLPGDEGYDEAVASLCCRDEETAKRQGFHHASSTQTPS